MTAAAAAPVMVRARITSAEWKAVRTLAIEQGRPVADLVAEALRAYLDTTPVVRDPEAWAAVAKAGR